MKRLVILVISLLMVLPIVTPSAHRIQAATSADVTVTAVGWVVTVNAPTDFTVVDNGANSVTISWVKGIGTTNTTIVCLREDQPAARDQGETLYTSNGTSFIYTGLAMETTVFYFSAWGWVAANGYSQDYAQADIGGDPMEAVALGITGLSISVELIASIIFNLAILGIALWRREGFLYLMAAPVAITFGWYWAGEQNVVAGIGFSAIGGYAIYLAIRQYVYPRGR